MGASVEMIKPVVIAGLIHGLKCRDVSFNWAGFSCFAFASILCPEFEGLTIKGNLPWCICYCFKT